MILFVAPLPLSNLLPYLCNLDKVTQQKKENEGGQTTNAKQEQKGEKNGKETEREAQVVVTDKQMKTRQWRVTQRNEGSDGFGGRKGFKKDKIRKEGCIYATFSVILENFV